MLTDYSKFSNEKVDHDQFHSNSRVVHNRQYQFFVESNTKLSYMAEFAYMYKKEKPFAVKQDSFQ